MKVDQPHMLVTGGAGFLGRHVVALAREHGWTVTAPTSQELDVRDDSTLQRAIAGTAPTAVVHLAYRAAERDTIVDGSGLVARAATTAGARLVHLSTDVVFHGRSEPYDEVDEPDPLSDYGRFKAEAEAGVRDAAPDAVLIRTSLLYGSGSLGACQRDVVRALDDPTTMAFFTDEVRCFTAVADVADAVVRLAADPTVSGPLHIVGPQALDRYAFACHVARWLGRDPAALRSSSLAATGLPRPANLVLTSTRAAALGLHCRRLDAVLPLPD